MYLNMFYYPVFAVSNIGMCAAKYTSTVFPTPDIGQDACVQVGLTLSELLKLILFRKFREQREGTSS